MLRAATLICLFQLLGCIGSFAKGATLASGTAGTTPWQVTSPLNFVPVAGFFPVTISATNNGPRPIKVAYQLSAHDHYGTSGTTVAGGSLDLPPHETASASHWIWRGSNFRHADSMSSISVSIKTPGGNSEDSLPGADQDSGASLAFSDALAAPRYGLIPSGGDQYVSSSWGTRVAVFDPADLPADWRFFSSIYGLYLTAADWDKLSVSVRDAIRTWIGFGGMVGIVDEDRAEAQRVADSLAPAGTAFGMFANHAPVTALMGAEVAEHAAKLRQYETAFAIGVPETVFNARSADSRRGGRYGSYRNPHGGKNQNFPLRDSFGRREIPYFAICMLLFVFAFLVGPASLRLWARPGQRHRLFLTTPLFSIAASALLLVVMLFQDGLGIKGRRFTVLDLAAADSPNPQALVYQEQFARAGMVAGGGFPIEPGLMPILPADTAEPSLTVRNDRAVGPWISSRRDRSLALVGATPMRWKVTHEGAGENSLELHVESPIAAFEEAWFVDGDGLVWKWDGEAGSAAGRLRFIPATRNARSVMRPMFDRCSADLANSILARVDLAGQRNRFWALAKDGTPAALGSHEKIKWLESPLVLTSRVAPAS